MPQYTLGGGGGSNGDLPFVHIADAELSRPTTGAVNQGIGIEQPDGQVFGAQAIGIGEITSIVAINSP